MADERIPPAAPTPPLAPAQLFRPADIHALAFATTADLPLPHALVGQERAQSALRFGAEIRMRGFNLFAIGAPTARVQQAVHGFLEHAVRDRAAPSDWVYVNNFAAPHRPVVLALPTGRAPELQREMRTLIDDLKIAIPAAFDSEDYQHRRGAIEEDYRGKNEKAFSALGEKAGAKSLVIVRTPMGFTVAPARKGQVMPPEEFSALAEDERHTIQAAIQ